jgi:hypothetical protein
VSDSHSPAQQLLAPLLALGLALLIGDGLKTLRLHRDFVVQLDERLNACPVAPVAPVVVTGTVIDEPAEPKPAPRTPRARALKSVK